MTLINDLSDEDLKAEYEYTKQNIGIEFRKKTRRIGPYYLIPIVLFGTAYITKEYFLVEGSTAGPALLVILGFMTVFLFTQSIFTDNQFEAEEKTRLNVIFNEMKRRRLV